MAFQSIGKSGVVRKFDKREAKKIRRDGEHVPMIAECLAGMVQSMRSQKRKNTCFEKFEGDGGSMKDNVEEKLRDCLTT